MAESETVFTPVRRARAATSEAAPVSAKSLRKIVFVCYGPFDCNSAGHIAGFANTLSGMGYSVAACAAGGLTEVYEFGEPAFEFFALDALVRDPSGVLAFDGAFRPDQTVIVCWTPREIVRRAVAPLVAEYRIPYVVHLEDNEEHIAHLKLDALKRRPWRKRRGVPESISDPAHLSEFLAGARGLTLIEERLREITPGDLPTLVLEPCVDLEKFGGKLAERRRATIRKAVGCSPQTTMLVYPGNVHRANADEVATLYEAIRLLRERGRDVRLVRTGSDTASAAALLVNTRTEAAVTSLGRVARTFLIDLLKSADLFVQPGRPGAFNDYRLPSKLPEFLAVGRPIVLPATNVGRKLRHGIDAMLLNEGSATEIARVVEEILSDPGLAARLSTNARDFAEAHYRPDEQGRKLELFLRQVI